MFIIGVDPGLTRFGIAVLQTNAVDDTAKNIIRKSGQTIELVQIGLLQTDKKLPVEKRLKQIFDDFSLWVERFKPSVIAVEKVFAQQNRHSILDTAQAMGIAMLVASLKNIPVQIYTPTQVKSMITGNGRASKMQVQNMVTRYLKLKGDILPPDNLKTLFPVPDTADATAIALCACWDCKKNSSGISKKID